jgi:TM2 domain-containing membrane protein YozV
MTYPNDPLRSPSPYDPSRGIPPPPPASPIYSTQAPMSEAGSKKLAAGLCAIFIGTFGIHKFILGYTTSGLIMLLVSLLTCGVGVVVMHVIGLIEGIMYLTKSDAEFYQTYMVGKKEWF